MGAEGRRSRKRRRGPATAAPHLETLLWRVGIRLVAGVDEGGMGPLAGPVVAAAVVFPAGFKLDGVADSKVLRAPVR
jgi:ribonuclease HII